ncbi:GNAT family N-acetyltransferase [Virgibacillus kekensis]|uniref:GNAT family N-acetyltransferase n=1 Tax=Virgibacillus kekensis TaxID=202261 RepID=A0ABV9DD95_9BACI
MIEIKKGDNKFYAGEDEQDPKAEITFQPSGENEIIVDHTYVSEELRGEGVAGKLVDKVVAYARGEGKKIYPTCEYTRSKLERNTNYHDVLAK